jgi:signal transduction histidine kinase
MVEMLNSKCGPLAQSAGVKYVATLHTQGAFSNREADLILLSLENLVQNAIEATPDGKTVQLRFFSEGPNILVEVEDQGPGLRAELAQRLFTPCSSAKKGGSGIGLAISRQLATHLGATLQLRTSSPSGCCFRLVLAMRDASPSPKPDEEAGRGTTLADPHRTVQLAAGRKASPESI